MRASPKECREHADHCRLMMANSPAALAKEFRRLADEWTRLAKDLERAQAFRPELAPRLARKLNIA
jgi:hypothetical protein